MRIAGSVVVIVFSWWTAAVAQLSAPPLASDPQLGAIKAPGTVILRGQVIFEDHSPPNASGSVVLQCGNDIRARSVLDSKGNFTLSLAAASRGVSPTAPLGQDTSAAWFGCEVYAELSGYRSDRVRLDESPDMGMVNVGRILVHPVAVEDQTFAVSVTSLQAPEKAKEAFLKGRDQERKGRWAAACQYFKRAIAAYPRYALAWLELGRSELKQNSFLDAQQSFEQAVRQDSHLVEGYAELARLAVAQQNWKELVDVTARLLELSPSASPQYWFLNSVAYFNLNQVTEAQAAVERGMRLDQKHQIPQMEYLYGLILARNKDYGAASEHIRAYLRLSPGASDAARARQTLADLDHLSTPDRSGHSTNQP